MRLAAWCGLVDILAGCLMLALGTLLTDSKRMWVDTVNKARYKVTPKAFPT